MIRQAQAERADYPRFLTIATRWMDNDIYGHVNNVAYYSYFDTVVNEHLISEGGLDIHAGTAMGLVVETRCLYNRPLSFPQIIDAGLRVAKLGNSSVTYDIGLFERGAEAPSATGYFRTRLGRTLDAAADAGACRHSRRAGAADDQEPVVLRLANVTCAQRCRHPSRGSSSNGSMQARDACLDNRKPPAPHRRRLCAQARLA